MVPGKSKISQLVKPQNLKSIIDAKQRIRIYTLGDSEVIGIDRLDIKIAVGELVALKGNSGSGKYALLSLIAELDRPTREELSVADHDLTRSTPR